MAMKRCGDCKHFQSAIPGIDAKRYRVLGWCTNPRFAEYAFLCLRPMFDLVGAWDKACAYIAEKDVQQKGIRQR